MGRKSSSSSGVGRTEFGISAENDPFLNIAAASDAMPGVTRSFASFDRAAAEAGMGRVCGGIHDSFDNLAGLALGRDIGRFVVAKTFSDTTPIRP